MITQINRNVESDICVAHYNTLSWPNSIASIVGTAYSVLLRFDTSLWKKTFLNVLQLIFAEIIVM
jgi:hypothetical protein